MSFVRTVLGDIRPGELGACYAHEHVIIDPSYTTQVFPDLLLDSVDKACLELSDFRAAGGAAMVDAMPCDAGRNVLKLAEISRRTGVHLLAPTGLHLPRFYPQGHWRFRIGADALADLFVDEIENGIDALDSAGPRVQRTSHRAGLIKVASASTLLSEAEREAFEAAAAAHRRTGAPILTHTERGMGLEQVRLLDGRGVDPGRVILSHADRHPDLDYHRALLRTGVNVSYDRVLRAPLDADNPTLRLAGTMLMDFPNQVMLGTDGARRSYWRSYGGSPGLDYLLTGFSRLLQEAGIGEGLLERAFVINPARAFAFRA